MESATQPEPENASVLLTADRQRGPVVLRNGPSEKWESYDYFLTTRV